MFIDYKVTATRRLFLADGTDIEEVKKLLSEDPVGFINGNADKMGIVVNDEYLFENERTVLDEKESTIFLYDCEEDEAGSPDWENLPPTGWPPMGCNKSNEFGKGLVLGIFDHGLTGLLQVQRLDEPADGFSQITDDQAEQLPKMAGYSFDGLGFVKTKTP
jgi:hypothetical protein